MCYNTKEDGYLDPDLHVKPTWISPNPWCVGQLFSLFSQWEFEISSSHIYPNKINWKAILWKKRGSLYHFVVINSEMTAKAVVKLFWLFNHPKKLWCLWRRHFLLLKIKMGSRVICANKINSEAFNIIKWDAVLWLLKWITLEQQPLKH